MNILVTRINFILIITWSLAYSCGQQWNRRDKKCRQIDDDFNDHNDVVVRCRLSCIFLFSGINFLCPKNCSWQDSWGFLFFLRFSKEFFTGMCFWRGHRNSGNSCGQEFLGAGISVFTQDSSGIPEDSCSHRKLSGSGQRLKKALC